MKQSILLISVMFLCGGLYNTTQAQNLRNIDSLMSLLEASKEDTNKVYNLNALAGELMQSNPDTAIILSSQALSLSEKLGWKKGTSISLGQLGVYYYLKNNFTAALDFYFKALKIEEEIGSKRKIEYYFGNIGMVYETEGDYPKALDYYFKALKMAEALKKKHSIAGHLISIGRVNFINEDISNALTYYLKALKMGEELGSKEILASCYLSVGIAYGEQEDYSKALDYFQKALKLQREMGEKYEEAQILTNLGAMYGRQGNNAKRIDYLFQALKVREEMGHYFGMGQILLSLGEVYTETGDFKKAELYLKKAISMNESQGFLYYLEASELAISALYDTTGRYKLALEHYKNAMAIKDTLFNQERDKQITRKEMNYEFDKKEAATKAEHNKKMAVADVEIKRQKLIKNFFIGGLVLLLLLSYFIYNNFRTAGKLKLQNIRNKIASDLHDDVGSTLNSISVYSEVAKQKSPTVVEELEQIGDASRKIIEVMSDIVWTINPNNDTFENIFSRMGTLAYNLLKAKEIEHTFQADESLNETKLSLESRRNFYLVFKEALNNLVKYSEATRVFITLKKENGLIKLVIRDNGIGFDVAQTSKGNGLLNMQARAKEMKAQLKIESENGKGTMVELMIKG